MYSAEHIKKALRRIAETMRENCALLSELDAAMGDGDLGVYMQKGFEKAAESVADNAGLPGSLLKTAGMSIMEEAPSTLGTLLGLFVCGMAVPLGERTEFDFHDFMEMFQSGYDQLVKRGKASLGEKTILDSLHPALTAMKMAEEAGKLPPECFRAGLDGAKAGLDASMAMRAVHGRPAYFGEKTVGMQDGGATVGVFIMQSLYAVSMEIQPSNDSAKS